MEITLPWLQIRSLGGGEEDEESKLSLVDLGGRRGSALRFSLLLGFYITEKRRDAGLGFCGEMRKLLDSRVCTEILCSGVVHHELD